MFGHRLLKARRQLQGRIWRALGLVAVAGGDGTVAKAARHMPDRNVPLALLPTGTANNVAHSLDLLGEAEEIAANLQGAPTRPLDLGSVKGHGANAVS
jgi:diacylglycerol kinase (ATP)